MDHGTNRIGALRRRRLEERNGAAAARAELQPDVYPLHVRIAWSFVQVLRHAWLNVYSLVALVAGVVFVVLVPQTREILANLELEGETGRVFAVAAIWAASIWYTMRVLSTTDFPGHMEAHPAAERVAAWLNEHSPRLAPFAGLAIIACTSAIFLREKPAPAWVPVLAAGVLPLAWAAARLGERLARLLGKTLAPQPVYPVSVLVIAVAAGAIASAVWSKVPEAIRAAREPWHLEEWLTLGCVAAALAALALRRRNAAHWLMAGSFALWLWVVIATRGRHDGSLLPVWLLAFAALGLWLTARRRELFSMSESASVPHFRVNRKTFAVLGVALAAHAALVIAFTYAPIALGTQMGTLAIVFLALSLCAFFGIVWVFIPKYLTWPSLALVPLVWALPLGNAPDHSLRGTKFDLAAAKARPRLAEHYSAWQAQLPKRSDNPVFFVAAAGGGLRAAYWTAHVLAAADDATCGEFGRHVYAYSGVSGGSLGIAAYLAQRQVWERKSAAERCAPGRSAEMARMLNRDFLAPVAGSLLFAEMAQRFVPLDYLDDDRGSTLARAWARAWDDVFPQAAGSFDRPFLEQFAALAPQDSAMPVRPAVFLNATGVESGRRAFAANVSAWIPGSIDIFRSVRGTALKTPGLSVREAVLNSARFTYVSPAATVFGCPLQKLGADGKCAEGREFLWGRLVDGGYFENSGLATLLDLVQALAPKKGEVQLFVIDNAAANDPTCRRPKGGAAEDTDQDELPANVQPLSGITAPVEAFLHVREARAGMEVRRARREFRCGQQLTDWDLFGERGTAQQAQKARERAEEAQHEPALGWFLSRRSARAMTEAGAKVAAGFPFAQAACAGPLPAAVRMRVGERSHPSPVCPGPSKN